MRDHLRAALATSARLDHPNTIGGLRFVVSVPFASRVVASRQRRSLLAG
jgi:hypothetical protein